MLRTVRVLVGLPVVGVLALETASGWDRRGPGADGGLIERRAPMLLEEPVCEMPPALRSVTGHALFRYEVSETGAVEQVETVYASTRADWQKEPFRAALESCLKRRRYRPALFGGKPLAERLLLGFHYFLPAPEGAGTVPLPGGGSIPRVHLDEMRREKLALAGQLLAGPSYTESRGEGWVLRADVRPEVLEAARQALLSARQAFEAAFGPTATSPDRPEATVLLFQGEQEFNEIAAFDNLVRMHIPIAGQYLPDERIIYTALGNGPASRMAGVLRHEITHHFVHMGLLPGGKSGPFWINEGIATFIECLRIPKKGPFVLTAIDRDPVKHGKLLWRPDADLFLERLEMESRANKLATMSDYLDLDRDTLVDPTLAYAMSWLMVHYLMTADEGRYREKFISCILNPEPGALTSAGLAAALGRPIQEVEKGLPGHLWRMRRP